MPDMRKVYYAQLLRILKQCHLAIEVLDARDMEGTRLRRLDRQFRSKVMLVATKEDLLQKPHTQKRTLDGMPLLYFSARTRDGLEEIFDEIRARAKAKDLQEIKVVIFGIPNVGKSSLINLMRGRHSAITGFKSGITRGPQWVRIRSGILLLDTPGVVSLSETRDDLALKAAENVENLKDPERVAIELIKKFSGRNDNSLLNFYGVGNAEDELVILESIAMRRGLLLKGGEPNTQEAAKIVIRDFQKGKFILVQT